MKRSREVMPCYRFRFLEFPVYFHGHALPPPIVKIILVYAQEMTIWEDMCQLHDRLEGTLNWLHQFKLDLAEHLTAYRILGSDNSVSEKISQDTRSLCHRTTVDLATSLNPTTRPTNRLPRRTWVLARTTTANRGFILPEMVNYT